jgi:hypothetical protein
LYLGARGASISGSVPDDPIFRAGVYFAILAAVVFAVLVGLVVTGVFDTKDCRTVIVNEVSVKVCK